MNPTALSRDVGEPFVKSFESCLAPVSGRPGFFRSYRCPANVITIGWGTTNENGHVIDMGTIWCQSECDEAFRADMAIFAKGVTQRLQGAAVTQAQFDALTSWTYNCGFCDGSAVWKYARAGDWKSTCEVLARYVNGGGRVLPGLVRRRKAECQLIRGDIDGALATAETHRAAPEPMAQRVDKPVPNPADIASRTKGAGSTAAVGAATAAASTQAAEPIVSHAILVTGAIVLAIALVFVVIKAHRVVRDWA